MWEHLRYLPCKNSVSKVKHQEADTIFLKKHIKEVNKDYINNRDTLVEFFTNYGFDKEQSDDLAYKMRNAVYYIKREKPERREIEISTMRAIKNQLKNKIKDVYHLLEQADLIMKFSTDKNFKSKIILKDLSYSLKIKSIPRAGNNIFFRLALAPLFWKLKKLEYGQSKQINLVYDLFCKYELDDYGTESEDGTKYIGEKEQKDRIRTQFQQPAMKYWDDFDQHLGSMVHFNNTVL